jgi:hypothetical protein
MEIDIDAVEDEYSKAADLSSRGKNPWPGMTYIDGVRDTLLWVMGDSDEAPLSELE